MPEKAHTIASLEAQKKFKRLKQKLQEKHDEVAIMILECFLKELLPKKKIRKHKKLFGLVSRWLKLWRRELKRCHEPEDLFMWTCHVSQELTRRSFSVWEIVSGKIPEKSVEAIARAINKQIGSFMEELEKKAKE